MRRRIESIMYGKDEEMGQGTLKCLLYGISVLYGRLQSVRRESYRRGWCTSVKLPCKVVSVGNIAVGGTGKTPMAAYLARTLQDMGKQVVVINRGYKGRGGSSPEVVSDGKQVLLDTLQSGDEAQMLARQLASIPVMTGDDRYRTGLAAIRRFNPDVIVLDDGFQHIRLQRDLDLVLLDRAAPLGNGHLLPRGTLREPADVLTFADAIIFTRATSESTAAAQACFVPPEKPVFETVHRPYLRDCVPNQRAGLMNIGEYRCSYDLSRLLKARATAFSGIARNLDFLRVLLENGAELASIHTFGDHHRFSRNDLNRVSKAARRAGADILVTTEKDMMRLPTDFEWPLDLLVVGVEIDFGAADAAFREFLETDIGF
jgi:tetraacyldisaccharide 4'-kinase